MGQMEPERAQFTCAGCGKHTPFTAGTLHSRATGGRKGFLCSLFEVELNTQQETCAGQRFACFPQTCKHRGRTTVSSFDTTNSALLPRISLGARGVWETTGEAVAWGAELPVVRHLAAKGRMLLLGAEAEVLARVLVKP